MFICKVRPFSAGMGSLPSRAPVSCQMSGWARSQGSGMLSGRQWPREGGWPRVPGTQTFCGRRGLLLSESHRRHFKQDNKQPSLNALCPYRWWVSLTRSRLLRLFPSPLFTRWPARAHTHTHAAHAHATSAAKVQLTKWNKSV